ncbi:MAG: hypothetical protein H6838_03850 [Planctomycetes bacterium]|nr:hypothetical protein [Planctomycetota bacterium]MCB9884599.1 hypothetical protein [Planctomycetota bacterium]
MTKSIALGLLTLAVSTSLTLAQDKPMGGWSAKPGSGLKYDGGDAFGLSFSNQLQIHWTYAALDAGVEDVNNFTIRRARTTLSGHVFNKNIEYKLQVDANDTGAGIKEGHVQWNFMNSDSGTIGLRFGQGKTLFGLEGTGTSKGLFFVERSSAARGFSDAYSRGVWLNGRYAESKLRWVLGAMNGNAGSASNAAAAGRGEEVNNDDNELSYVATVNFDPMGDYFGGKQTTESKSQGDFRTDDKKLVGTIGAGIAMGNGKGTATGGADLESTTYTLNTAWSVNNLQFLGEYFMRSDEVTGAPKEEPTGYAVSAMYVMPKSGDSDMQWGFGLRYNGVATDDTVTYFTGLQGIGAAPGDASEITAVVNAFYHGHACKTQLEYTWQDVQPDAGGDTTNHIFRVAFQLLF